MSVVGGGGDDGPVVLRIRADTRGAEQDVTRLLGRAREAATRMGSEVATSVGRAVGASLTAATAGGFAALAQPGAGALSFGVGAVQGAAGALPGAARGVATAVGTAALGPIGGAIAGAVADVAGQAGGALLNRAIAPTAGTLEFTEGRLLETFGGAAAAGLPLPADLLRRAGGLFATQGRNLQEFRAVARRVAEEVTGSAAATFRVRR